MKNSKRMIAVIAASGLALGSLPGVANAQSAELGLGVAANLGSADLGVDLGLALGSIEPSDLPDLKPDTGSLGSLGDVTGSADDIETLPAPGTSSLGDLTEDSGSSEGSNGEGSNGGETGGDAGTDGTGSLGSLTDSLEPENGTEFDLLGSLEEMFAGSSDATDTENPNTGSGEGSNGSSDEGAGDDNDSGDIDSGSLGSSAPEDDDNTDENDFFGSLTDTLGSLSSGSDGGEENEEDSLFGSLEDIFSGSSEGSNGEETPDPGANNQETPGSGGEIDAGTLLALGSLAGAGIAIGIAVNGGVNLPPLPGVDVGAVCNLPQEGIDFLKNNGSMEQDECEPEQQPVR
ncbi:hypothetical protein ACWIE7_09125 [Dietzia sp. NPDC055343]